MSYVLGLDIGVGKIGYSVVNLDENKIEIMGVFGYPLGQNEKGQLLSVGRRNKRGQRRTIRRKAIRMKAVKELLTEKYAFVSVSDYDSIFKNYNHEYNPWKLRVNGLDDKLNNTELVRVLVHLAKHRGFKSNRKVVSDAKSDDGKAKSAINLNNELLKNYRTVGEMFAVNEQFKDKKRNSDGKYQCTLARDMVLEEAEIILENQKTLGNNNITDEFIKKYIDIISFQKHYAPEDQIEKMVGFCTFEKGELRAPKMSYSAEMFILLQKLNNMKINNEFLSKEQKNIIKEKALNSAKLTYKQIRKLLDLNDDERINGFNLPRNNNINNNKETINKIFSDKVNNVPQEVKETVTEIINYLEIDDVKSVLKKKNISEKFVNKILDYYKDNYWFKGEKSDFISMKGFNAIKKVFNKETEALINDTVFDNNIEKKKIDIIAEALTYRKEDSEIEKYLYERNFSEEEIEKIKNIPDFTKTSHLSLKALYKILPCLEEGDKYSDAVEKCGYTDETYKRKKYLSAIDVQNITNPVVKRGISNVRKLVNAIINKYGSPYKIHIELARDAAKSQKEKDKIQKNIDENRKLNKTYEDEIHLIDENVKINADLLLKVKLYHEQNGQSSYNIDAECPYSFKPIDFRSLIKDPTYCEVDHVLPYSRSLDNSVSNKVLVLTEENRQKKNRTPYEYFGTDKERWRIFEEKVKSSHFSLTKKANLLNKKFGTNEQSEQDFKDRQLKDTQYMCRFIKNILEKQLKFNNEDKKTVDCFNGRAVENARWLWGLGKKDRDLDDTHHAVDAVIIACMTDRNLQIITDYLKIKETDEIPEKEKEEYERLKETQKRVKYLIKKPWKNFRYDVLNYLKDHNLEEYVTDGVSSLAPKDNQKSGRIFVSRKPNKRIAGELHQDTIKGAIKDKEGNIKKVTYRKALTKLTKGDFTEEIINNKKVKKLKMFNREQDLALAELIEKRMEENNYDGTKAFAEQLYKPAGPNSKEPPHKVEKIKLCDNYTTGFEIPKVNGVADNAKMIRSDIFTKDGRYYIVPVYTWQIAMGEMPNKAIVANKDEDEWIEMTEDYTFLFSLYPYDLVHIKTNHQNSFGFYRGVHRRTGSITLSFINNNSETFTSGISTADFVHKYNVDILGNYHIVKKEKRQWKTDRNSNKQKEN